MARIHPPPILLVLVLVLHLPLLATSQPNEDGSLPASAADSVSDASIPNPVTTVFQTLSNTEFGDFEVLRYLLPALDLSGNLDSPGGRVTLFAPPDDAFISLIRRIRPDLANGIISFETRSILTALNESLAPFRNMPIANFVSLRDIIAYHILNDALDYDSIEAQSPLNTTAGIPISVVNGLIVDQDPFQDVSPSIRDIFNLNGWLHVVPSVLLPFDLTNALDSIPTPSPSTFASPVPTPDATEPPIETSLAPTVTPTPLVVPEESSPEESAGVTDPNEELDGTAEGDEPAESPEDDPVCFPPTAQVELSDGRVARMSELRAGDVVRVHEDGRVSAVFAWTHRMEGRRTVFYQLRTANGYTVRMTGGHYVYANGVLTAARAVRKGDLLRTVGGGSEVVGVAVERGTGLFAPHTVHGDLVVDGVVVSGYSKAVAPWAAHALLAPVRGLVRWAGVTEPLGAVFYGGADALARWMPSGRDRY